jgi:hypothetical protein
MPIYIIDAVYYELVINPDKFDGDRHIRDFLKMYATPKFTDNGELLLERRLAGKTTKNFGEAAIAEFLRNDIENIAKKNPVLLLFEDHKMLRNIDLAFPDNVHFLSTVAMIRGLAELKIISELNAENIIECITNSPKPRKIADMPDGTDIESRIGSYWKPDIPSPDEAETCAIWFFQERLDPRGSAGEIERFWGEHAEVIRNMLRDLALNPHLYGIEPDHVKEWGEGLDLGRIRMCPGTNGPIVTTVYDDF